MELRSKPPAADWAGKRIVIMQSKTTTKLESIPEFSARGSGLGGLAVGSVVFSGSYLNVLEEDPAVIARRAGLSLDGLSCAIAKGYTCAWEVVPGSGLAFKRPSSNTAAGLRPGAVVESRLAQTRDPSAALRVASVLTGPV